MLPSAFALASSIAFAMAWAIGAQDVSNALGTSVGSKAVTVRQAIYIAGICEFVGSREIYGRESRHTHVHGTWSGHQHRETLVGKHLAFGEGRN